MAVRRKQNGEAWMMEQVLQVMDIKKGHIDMKYDPDDPKDVKNMVSFIRGKQNEGFRLYSIDKNGEYHIIQNVKHIDDSKLKEFILTKEMKKKMVSIPSTGG